MIRLLGRRHRRAPGIEIAGEAGVLQPLLGVLDQGDPYFDIVTP